MSTPPSTAAATPPKSEAIIADFKQKIKSTPAWVTFPQCIDDSLLQQSTTGSAKMLGLRATRLWYKISRLATPETANKELWKLTGGKRAGIPHLEGLFVQLSTDRPRTADEKRQPSAKALSTPMSGRKIAKLKSEFISITNTLRTKRNTDDAGPMSSPDAGKRRRLDEVPADDCIVVQRSLTTNKVPRSSLESSLERTSEDMWADLHAKLKDELEDVADAYRQSNYELTKADENVVRCQHELQSCQAKLELHDRDIAAFQDRLAQVVSNANGRS
ncbi:hypothetical protein AAFC00_004415 [Neodothiora populina]|uniref:Uncharacterized protein n=1 Tax=Neodothiora populina TaxID=2781224 RepID=A0ABR3PPK0_9PEZI